MSAVVRTSFLQKLARSTWTEILKWWRKSADPYAFCTDMDSSRISGASPVSCMKAVRETRASSCVCRGRALPPSFSTIERWLHTKPYGPWRQTTGRPSWITSKTMRYKLFVSTNC